MRAAGPRAGLNGKHRLQGTRVATSSKNKEHHKARTRAKRSDGRLPLPVGHEPGSVDRAETYEPSAKLRKQAPAVHRKHRKRITPSTSAGDLKPATSLSKRRARGQAVVRPMDGMRRTRKSKTLPCDMVEAKQFSARHEEFTVITCFALMVSWLGPPPPRVPDRHVFSSTLSPIGGHTRHTPIQAQ
jgi:hypothetical protein